MSSFVQPWNDSRKPTAMPAHIPEMRTLADQAVLTEHEIEAFLPNSLPVVRSSIVPRGYDPNQFGPVISAGTIAVPVANPASGKRPSRLKWLKQRWLSK